VASLTAARTNDLKTEMAAFVDRANGIRDSAAMRMNLLQDQTKAIQIDTAALIQIWTATANDKSKLARNIFDAVTVFGKSATLPAAPPPLFTPSATDTVKIKFDPAQYEALIKQLNSLATQKSILDEATFLAGFAQAVDKNYKADIGKATNAIATTNDTANKTAAAAPKP
jgi:hypothetical protein